jgi:hypothetical protein
MSRATVGDGPAFFGNIPIRRGDDVSRLFELFSSFAGADGDTATVQLDLTGRTYTSSIATSRGGSVVSSAAPTVTVPLATNGQIVWSLTDTQTDTLTARSYFFDVIENADTGAERTIIEGTLTVSGRATP